MDFRALTDYLDSLPGIGIPGVDCIVQSGYQTVYRHWSGFADREEGLPMGGQERFFLYSSSKPITCLAALQLYERGKFLLTDPLYEYIPEFKHMAVKRTLENGETVLEETKNPVRISHLFAMTGGFSYELDIPSVRRVQESTDGRAPTLAVAKALAEEPLLFEPGTQWHYSISHDIIGALIEVLSGKSFGEYLKENIFAPLGMTRTGFERTPEVLGSMMAQYQRDDETGAVTQVGLENKYILGTEYESGGAGLISCTEDYIKFTSALANGGYGASGNRIISRGTIDLMRTNFLDPGIIKTMDWAELQGYGYGLGVRTMMDRAVCGSNGTQGEFGWCGAAGTYLLIDPERKLSLFYAQQVLENRSGKFQPRMRNNRIRNILYGCL